MEARLGHYGKHYFVSTPIELKGTGIKLIEKYKASGLTSAGIYKAGWYKYQVTSNAFEKLEKEYTIGFENHLD